MPTPHRTIPLAALVLSTALAVTGCAGDAPAEPDAPRADASTPAATPQPFDDADVQFAQMMIPHHEQAVEMSDILLAKDGVDPEVRELAEQIRDAQQPEIDTMRAWLDEWGAEEVDDAGGAHAGHGMMSAGDLDALEDADGADASRLFLEQMIVHHEGAIMMADIQAEDGEHPDAVRMAEQIIATQAEEIELMRDLLGER